MYGDNNTFVLVRRQGNDRFARRTDKLSREVGSND